MNYTLITGASSGMGAAAAIRLSQTRPLVLASENIAQLEAVRQQCVNPESHILWHCDFAAERGTIFSSLTNLMVARDVKIEEYVHFAGISILLPVKNFTMTYVDKVFNVNFFSIIEILRVLLKKANGGMLKNIVLISALVSERGNIGNSIYAASKGAINSLVYTLARELAPKTRINALLPGAIMTPMTANLDSEYLKEMEKDSPLGFGTPDDVVDYVEFLLSEKSKWITGQTLFVDGGRSTK